PHHRPAQLVQQCPSVLVAAQTKHTLQAQGADAIFLGSHLPHGPKPNRQRQFAVLEDRARQDRGFPTAVFTTPKMASDRQPAATTGGTNKTLRPPQGKQIGPAIRFVTEAPFQFQKRARIILCHRRKHYHREAVESCQYPYWGMGDNSSGELGDGTYDNTNLPMQIVASNVTAIAAGGGNHHYFPIFAHSLFLKGT